MSKAFELVGRNMSLRAALSLAPRVGCEVRDVRGTGEVLVMHPKFGRVRQNARRKDTTRKLLTLLRRAVEESGVAAGAGA